MVREGLRMMRRSPRLHFLLFIAKNAAEIYGRIREIARGKSSISFIGLISCISWRNENSEPIELIKLFKLFEPLGIG